MIISSLHTGIDRNRVIIKTTKTWKVFPQVQNIPISIPWMPNQSQDKTYINMLHIKLFLLTMNLVE